MNSSEFAPQASWAIESVFQAMALGKQIQRSIRDLKLTKDDKSPVTVADFAIQALIGRSLQKRYPGMPLVGEEKADSLRNEEGESVLAKVISHLELFAPRATEKDVLDWVSQGEQETCEEFWTLDPVDGTKGFIRGDQYAVALALIREGKVEIGVLGCPNLNLKSFPESLEQGVLIIAARGKGSWIVNRDTGAFLPVKVSRQNQFQKAVAIRSLEKSHTNTGRVSSVLEALSVEVPPIQMDSQAKHAVVAGGDADLLFYFLSPDEPSRKIKIWDQAAGALIVEEAGGKVTDLDGRSLDFSCGNKLANNRGVLVTNGLLHTEALLAIRKLKI